MYWSQDKGLAGTCPILCVADNLGHLFVMLPDLVDGALEFFSLEGRDDVLVSLRQLHQHLLYSLTSFHHGEVATLEETCVSYIAVHDASVNSCLLPIPSTSSVRSNKQ